jgi:hypothetical protein
MPNLKLRITDKKLIKLYIKFIGLHELLKKKKKKQTNKHVHTRGERGIRTSDIRFIKCSHSQLNYLLGTITD